MQSKGPAEHFFIQHVNKKLRNLFKKQRDIDKLKQCKELSELQQKKVEQGSQLEEKIGSLEEIKLMFQEAQQENKANVEAKQQDEIVERVAGLLTLLHLTEQQKHTMQTRQINKDAMHSTILFDHDTHSFIHMENTVTHRLNKYLQQEDDQSLMVSHAIDTIRKSTSLYHQDLRYEFAQEEEGEKGQDGGEGEEGEESGEEGEEGEESGEEGEESGEEGEEIAYELYSDEEEEDEEVRKEYVEKKEREERESEESVKEEDEREGVEERGQNSNYRGRRGYNNYNRGRRGGFSTRGRGGYQCQGQSYHNPPKESAESEAYRGGYKNRGSYGNNRYRRGGQDREEGWRGDTEYKTNRGKRGWGNPNNSTNPRYH